MIGINVSQIYVRSIKSYISMEHVETVSQIQDLMILERKVLVGYAKLKNAMIVKFFKQMDLALNVHVSRGDRAAKNADRIPVPQIRSF